MCGDPNVQVNVTQRECGEIAPDTHQVAVELDDAQGVFVWGPVDLATARAALVSFASRTNVRRATIQPIA